MFRNLIPQLPDDYHVIAPELPGFGFTRKIIHKPKLYSTDTGHFALETHAAEIGAEIQSFLAAALKK